jgi:hypothetical protein
MHKPLLIIEVYMSLYGDCKLTENFNLYVKVKFQNSKRRKHNSVTYADYK